MSILVNASTKVLVQGITGSFGGRHTQLSLAYGTQVVAGVTPGKGGQRFENKVPIFDTVAEAVQATHAVQVALDRRDNGGDAEAGRPATPPATPPATLRTTGRTRQ